jgi:hypothetical protein
LTAAVNGSWERRLAARLADIDRLLQDVID